MRNEQNKTSVKWAVVILSIVVIVIGGSIAALSLRPEKKVTDFESCKATGGAILEMYPEQCRINGASYTNEAQPHPDYPEEPAIEDDYVGLSESEALARAEKESTPARVVERDSEALPVTMDFVFGRRNLYVKDGVVYKVEIEGQATDSPMKTDQG